MAASPDSEKFFKASDFADDFLKKNGKSHLEARLVTDWPRIVGDTIAGVSKVTWVSQDELRITVKDPLWLTELEYRKGDILRKIKALFPETAVERLRFFLDKRSVKNDYGMDVIAGYPGSKIKLDLGETEPIAPKVLEEPFLSAPVTDPDLKKSLARLRETSLRVEAFRKKHPDFDTPAPIPPRLTDETMEWYLPDTGISSEFLNLDPDRP